MRNTLSLIALSLFATTAFAQKEFGFDNKKSTAQPYMTPEETVRKMTVPPEFEVKLFAGEPLVVNPVAFTIDEKGRVWVLECFEYPSRTPAGKMPRDRIVILEDTDGDGKCDKRTVFAEGKDFPERFDLATGLEVGNGGVYVGAPPYLYFIENKNDKPGKFTKLLSGFGSQDTHETLNTFQWGPDGWLYGLHGIYTISNVKNQQLDGPEQRMNAAVWRYHPITKKFETYAEGTSNPWGMDWRNTDGQFILCACVIPHLYHIVPGGNYRRQGGTGSNPYAYGDIKEICDHTFHKESGWAHAGLISLDVPHMPERFRNSVIFGSIHGSSLKQNILKPNGSTYTASRGDDFLTSGDKNFRPINMKWGPQGDIYLIDWHDQNPCHQAASDSWDYERGRIYRIQLKGTTPKKADDLSKKDEHDLGKLAFDPNPYISRTSARLIRELDESKRFSATIGAASITDNIKEDQVFRLNHFENATSTSSLNDLPSAVESVERALALPHQFAWGIHSMHQTRTDTPILIQSFTVLARHTKHASIRRAIASAAIQLADKHNVDLLLHTLLERKEDATDPLIPQLIWNAHEKALASGGRQPPDSPPGPNQGTNPPRSPLSTELDWLSKNVIGNPLIRDFILPRVMRRIEAMGKPEHLALCVKFIADCKDAACREKALEGLVIALKDRKAEVPAGWPALRGELLALKNEKITSHVNTLAVAFRDPEAAKAALAIAKDDSQAVPSRVEAVKQLAQLKPPETPSLFLEMLKTANPLPLQVEAARALAAFNEPKVASAIVGTWWQYKPEVQKELVNTLASRKDSAMALLNAVKAKTIDRMLLSDSHITRMQSFKDKVLDKLIDEAWGKSRATPAELLKQIDAMRKDLAAVSGSFAKGKAVFEAQCAKCHQFEGKGSAVGPALDGAGRDIEYLLANILDPNRVIGAPYFIRQATTSDGQLIQGILAEEDDRTITLKVENGVLKKIAKADLEGPVKVLEKSLMPEGLTAAMKVQDFRDLTRYLMAHPFPNKVSVNGTAAVAPVSGLISLPESKTPITLEFEFTAADSLSTKMLIGSANPFEVFVDGKSIAKGNGTERSLKPDSESFDVSLPKGTHHLKLIVQPKWASAGVYIRMLDPNRKVMWAE
ncbi:hypothetical protein BH11PLA2_BH11PLA2_31910 [soil metagenome]